MQFISEDVASTVFKGIALISFELWKLNLDLTLPQCLRTLLGLSNGLSSEEVPRMAPEMEEDVDNKDSEALSFVMLVDCCLAVEEVATAVVMADEEPSCSMRCIRSTCFFSRSCKSMFDVDEERLVAQKTSLNISDWVESDFRDSRLLVIGQWDIGQ